MGISNDARADWYDDAKDVVEQLVQDDIATQAVPNAAQHIKAVCDFFPQTVGALEDKRYSGVPTVLRKEAADALGYLIATEIGPDLEVAAPAGSATQGDSHSTVTQKLMSVSTLNVASIQSRKAAPPPDQQSTAWCLFPSQATTSKLAQAKTSPGNSAPPVAKQSIATSALQACIAPQKTLQDEIGCAAGLLLRDDADGTTSLLPGDVRRLVSAVLVEALQAAGVNLGTDPQTVVLAGDIAALLANPATSASQFANAACLLIYPGGSGTSAFDACVQTITPAANALLSGKLGLNTVTLQEALALVHAIATVLEAKFPGGTLNEILTIVDGIATGGEQVAQDVASKNYGAAAGEVMSTVVALACPDDSKAGCTSQDQTVYKFLEALAVYSIDSIESGSPGSSPDANFRTAAVDMIEAWSGSGVRRKYSAAYLYIPEFALRDAFRPGHIGSTGSDLMIYPSIDLVRVRVRPNTGHLIYLGFQFSALDALGPFSELATRNSALANDSKATAVFFAGFLVPRLDVELGIPRLSQNLVIGAGGALRLFRAQNPAAPEYCVFASCSASGTDKWPTWSNGELSVFVKYVP